MILPNPDTLRTYAKIFEAKRRDPVTGSLCEPTEICLAAAQALYFQAEMLTICGHK